MFKGIITALITPFRDGKVDEKALATLVNWQAEQGVDGVVPCGTTGESMFLSHDEQRRVIEICKETAGDRLKIIPGTGAVSTGEAIRLTQQAQECGADGALIITPWYVKPSQDSLIQHFKDIHDVTSLPIILYNNPVRTGVELKMDTVVKLSQLERISGIKDASPDLTRAQHFRAVIGENFSLLVGDDPVFPAYLAMGGDGIISSATNVAPHVFTTLHRAWGLGDMAEFDKLRDLLHPLLHALTVAANPHPIKFATSLMADITLETRLPFSPLNSEDCEKIRSAMKALGSWQEQPFLQAAPA